MFMRLGRMLLPKQDKPGLRDFIRSRHNQRRNFKKRTELNPGVNLQAKLLDDGAGRTLNADELDFEYLESDFMSAGLTHKQHVAQMELQKEKEKYLIVGRKYFKEKTPNFLTWSDKQQIRYLHGTDPEQWTIEKLSEGFPALPETISKIVKTSWPKQNSKVKNHDASVATNWELFKNGKIAELPEQLAEHLNKFSDRRLNFDSCDLYERDEPAYNDERGDFSEIISSYKRITDKRVAVNVVAPSGTKPKKETYLTEPFEQFKDKENITLVRLQMELQAKAQAGSDISQEDQILLQRMKEPRGIAATVTDNPIVDVTDCATTSELSTDVRETKRIHSHLVYPDRIAIPKSKYRRGYTYKLNDCFYDSDGHFLYRVPGMDQ